MAHRPTYEELEKKVQELEKESELRQQAEEKLKAFLSVFEQSSNSIAILGLDGKVEYANPKLLDAYKVNPEDVIGKSWRSFLSMSSTLRENLPQIRNTVLEKGLMWKGEVSDLSDTGIAIWRGATIFPVKNDKGQIIHAVYLSEDITDRKRAEEALSESEEKYRLFVESANEGIILTQNGKLRYMNPRAIEFMGYSEEELKSQHFTNFIHPDDKETVIELYLSKMKGEDVPPGSSYRIINKSGTAKWVQSRSTVLNWEGKPSLLTFLIDNTERKQAEEALRESEKRLNAILDATTETIALFDREGIVYVANQIVCDRLGTSKENFIGRSIYDFFAPEVAESRIPKYNEVFDTGKPKHWEDGRSGILFWNSVYPIFGEGSQVEMVAAFASDITDRKRAEEKIQEQYRFLKTLFDAIPFPFYLKDTNAQYLGCSPSYAEIIGVNTEEVVGKRAEDIFSDDIAAIHNQADQDLFQNPGTQVYEYRLKYADGSLHDNIVSKATYNDDNGSLAGMVGFYTDITERNRAEEALRESEERYRLLFNSANDAVFVHQPSAEGKPRKFIEVNDVACKMYGYTREALLELSPLDLVMSGQEEEARIRLRKLLSEKYSFFEIVHKTKDGKEIPVEINAHLFDFKGRPTILSIARDMTERKRSEARLQQSQKMEAIGTLAGGIAHDFNNILSPVLGHAELLMYDLSDDSPFQASVNEIYRASLRARDLVQQILAFSRQTEDELKPIRIHPAVKEAIKLLRASLPKTIDIEQNIDLNCGAVIAAPTQIHQIAMNLATNAYHAMEDIGGTLRVALKQFQMEPDQSESMGLAPGTYACLTVSDTGVGIEKNILDKIFDPYFTTKEKNKGTGLGLSVVHGIVKGYGGDIHIYSEPGKGTEVYVYLPIIESKIEEGAKDSLESIQGGTEKILLVDDEEAIVRIEQQMLKQLGYEVTTRAGSVDAFEAFKANPDRYDLIVTDMTMPNMTGIQLTQEIKKIRPEIPVIICTGFSEQINEEKCKVMGIQGYVMKPIIRKEFAATIRKVLDRKVIS